MLVVFMCNHSLYVKHIREVIVKIIREYQQRGVAAIAINSNDIEQFHDDCPDRMKEDARIYGYSFPYLFDGTQDVARMFRVSCTPDFFVFNKEGKLVYHGQMDDSRPGNNIPVTGKDLSAALDAVLEGKKVSDMQRPSMGCNIKWKESNQPDYS